MTAVLRALLRPLLLKPSLDQVDVGQITHEGFALTDVFRIKITELWLMLGESDLAPKELESLSEKASRHPWALRVKLKVFSALSFC